MKVEGIDHVAIKVKDIDKAMELFGKLFEMEFEELPGAESRGARVAISRPDAQIEFMQPLDAAKAAHYTSIDQGIFKMFFRVNDADEAVADAEKKGIPIDRIQEEKQLTDFLPHIKHLWFSEEKFPIDWLGLIWKPPEKK